MKESIDPYEELMIRSLDGDATGEEQNQLNNWLQESPTNQSTFEDFQKIWIGAVDIPMLQSLDIEADLKAVKKKAAVANLLQEKTPTGKVIPLKSTTTRSWSFLQKIAAILLPIAVLTTALFLYFNQNTSNEPMLLSDGTKVWLYKDAQLDYPANFTSTTRSVKLKGEAYFEVAHDANKPFIIEAGAAAIEVLGTSFNVQSTANQTNVVVNTGKVRLTATANTTQTVELTKGEKGIYEQASVREITNMDKNYRSWHTGIFEFDGTASIETVLQQLSKYYGPIAINTAANRDCLLEASFEKEDLETILETIKNSCSF